MQFKYNEIRQLKEKWDDIESAIEAKSELVFKALNLGGYICSGFWFTTGDDGRIYINQNYWDGYDGENPPNCHLTYPFGWLNEPDEDIYGLVKTESNSATCSEGAGC